MAATDGEALGDSFSPRRLLSSETVYDGRIWDVVQDTFEYTPGGAPLVRDYINHPGAVAVLNRAGLGPFNPRLTGEELRRAGLSDAPPGLVSRG